MDGCQVQECRLVIPHPARTQHLLLPVLHWLYQCSDQGQAIRDKHNRTNRFPLLSPNDIPVPRGLYTMQFMILSAVSIQDTLFPLICPCICVMVEGREWFPPHTPCFWACINRTLPWCSTSQRSVLIYLIKFPTCPSQFGVFKKWVIDITGRHREEGSGLSHLSGSKCY